MSEQRGDKLNKLINSWEPGTVMTAALLGLMGIGAALLWKYVKRGWLEPIQRGAYVRVDDKVDWRGGLYALQQDAHGLKFHAGGRTALELLGYGHYGSERERGFFLFGPPKSRLPKWFVDNDWGVKLVFSATGFLSYDLPESYTQHEVKGFSIIISSPERAVLELLYHVPKKVGFDEAEKLLLGLSTLRPRVLQELLEECVNIKVKRLFLYLARESGHRWFKHIAQDRIGLGSGNREIVKGGVLDREYKITVPQAAGQEEFF